MLSDRSEESDSKTNPNLNIINKPLFKLEIIDDGLCRIEAHCEPHEKMNFANQVNQVNQVNQEESKNEIRVNSNNSNNYSSNSNNLHPQDEESVSDSLNFSKTISNLSFQTMRISKNSLIGSLRLATGTSNNNIDLNQIDSQALIRLSSVFSTNKLDFDSVVIDDGQSENFEKFFQTNFHQNQHENEENDNTF